MDEEQSNCERSHTTWFSAFLTVLVSLSIGFASGYMYRFHKTKAQVDIGSWVGEQLGMMRTTVALDRHFGEEKTVNLKQEYYIDNNAPTFSWIEVHVMEMGKQQDVGNPEKDGKAPTEDADKWATKDQTTQSSTTDSQ
jgi:hypothetical protein